MAQTRRTFLAASAALAAAPFARAQQTGHRPQVGVLSLYTPEVDAHLWKALKDRMTALGWIEGRTVAYTLRRANNQPARLPELAAELAQSSVSVIFAGGDLPTQALIKAGGKTPVVFAAVNDPVKMGYVESYARPGGRITGLAATTVEHLVGKRLEFLREVVPGTTHVGILVNKHRGLDAFLAAQAEAAKQLELSTVIYEVNSASEIEAAFASMVTSKIRAGAIGTGQLLFKERNLIGTLSKQHAIPFVANSEKYVEAGCLISYTGSYVAQVERAAEMIDKILRGASPADIPVESSREFNLVVSLKAARDLNISVPQSVLLRATRIIE